MEIRPWPVRKQEFILEVAVVGQREGVVPSNVRYLLPAGTGIQNDESKSIQPTNKTCTPISYRLFAISNITTLSLYPDNGACEGVERFYTNVTVKFQDCPDGFALNKSECVCDERLRMFNARCNVDDSSIERESNSFWIGPHYDDNQTFQGLITYRGCPFDYCVDTPVQVTLDNYDIQCDHNRSGILCGQCNASYSIAFGTFHCIRCNDVYLLMIIPIALAGIALVALIFVLRLTIAAGTLNGFIFYANVIEANRPVFFSRGHPKALSVFISWLNLDLGIESCFYDGMDAHAFSWLQYLFPFYLWLLVGLIIAVSRYSRRVTRVFGTNPVSVLATLLLLSYSKILRTVVLTLSYRRVQYPDGPQRVWLYDGNIQYLKDPRHIALATFSIVVLLFLFLPYTILLLCGHWLQAYSHWKPLSWLNRIKPFMDAYHAPYKKSARYWTGLLLVVRCVFFLVFALDVDSNSNFNATYITIISTACVLLTIAWLQKGLYEKLYNDMLEGLFILNLCVFAVFSSYDDGDAPRRGTVVKWPAYFFIGIAFIIFILIMTFNVYTVVSSTSLGKKIIREVHNLRYGTNRSDTGSVNSQEQSRPINRLSRVVQSQRPPRVVTFTELRESLLADQ